MDKTIYQKIFPDKEYMKRGYGLEKTYGIWLFAAHIKRWFGIFCNIITGRKKLDTYLYGKSKDISGQAKERIELFEMLDIID
ncbi:MAG: hypothetical protein IJN36_00200 [Clostridia bacterium]|nr:hypothetical protein [Clostridia bacterium]